MAIGLNLFFFIPVPDHCRADHNLDLHGIGTSSRCTQVARQVFIGLMGAVSLLHLSVSAHGLGAPLPDISDGSRMKQIALPYCCADDDVVVVFTYFCFSNSFALFAPCSCGVVWVHFVMEFSDNTKKKRTHDMNHLRFVVGALLVVFTCVLLQFRSLANKMVRE